MHPTPSLYMLTRIVDVSFLELVNHDHELCQFRIMAHVSFVPCPYFVGDFVSLWTCIEFLDYDLLTCSIVYCVLRVSADFLECRLLIDVWWQPVITVYVPPLLLCVYPLTSASLSLVIRTGIFVGQPCVVHLLSMISCWSFSLLTR